MDALLYLERGEGLTGLLISRDPAAAERELPIMPDEWRRVPGGEAWYAPIRLAEREILHLNGYDAVRLENPESLPAALVLEEGLQRYLRQRDASVDYWAERILVNYVAPLRNASLAGDADMLADLAADFSELSKNGLPEVYHALFTEQSADLYMRILEQPDYPRSRTTPRIQLLSALLSQDEEAFSAAARVLRRER